MEQTDSTMKKTMTYLFSGLFGVFFGIVYLVNVIVY